MSWPGFAGKKGSTPPGKRKEWVIVVAQDVKGKSKFPRNQGFKRYKPYPYKKSSEPHRIVYARYFVGTEEDAKTFGSNVEDKMFDMYIGSMANTKHYCVSEYTMVLHDITADTSQQLASTIADNDSAKDGYLYSDAVCSNKLLSKWGIVDGF
jgi:hypothetical protein